MTEPQTELNPQPRRDIRLIAMAHLVTATITYGDRGQPVDLRLRADNATDYVNEQLGVFADGVSSVLRAGHTPDDIEKWCRDGGVPNAVLEPLLSVLREPPT